MTNLSLFLNDTQDFEAAKSEIEKVFIVDGGLPARVFKSVYRQFAFEQFLWMLSGDVWPAIQQLAKSSNDETVLMAVLEPKPDSYYKREFGYYNWVRLPISQFGVDYWKLLNQHPPESPADSILCISETILWLPPSAKWAIWGDRGYDICVLGGVQAADPWHDLAWAVEYMRGNFRERRHGEAFIAELMANYRSSTE